MSGATRPVRDRESARRYRGKSAEDRRSERRESLIEAGLERFGTEGYAATSVKAICELAGLSPRYFYEHFADREDLMLAVFSRVASEVMTASIAASEAAPPEVEAKVRAGIRAYLEPLAADRRKARVLFAESVGVSTELEEARRSQITEFASYVREQSLALGAVAAETPENELIAYGLIGANHEITNQALLHSDDFDLDAVCEQCCTIFLGTSERLARS